jgi:polysaccharide pyruvyl transferase WcaK-like protein
MDATNPLPVTRRIAIMGHVGNENLGDEAIISAVIARLRAKAPGVELIAFTSNPDDTTARHGVPAHPIRLAAERGSK